jgi:chromosome segregation ATPase
MNWLGQKKEEYNIGKRQAYAGGATVAPKPDDGSPAAVDDPAAASAAVVAELDAAKLELRRVEAEGGVSADEIQRLKAKVEELKLNAKDEVLRGAEFENKRLRPIFQKQQDDIAAGQAGMDARDAKIVSQSGEIGDYARQSADQEGQIETLEQDIRTSQQTHDEAMEAAAAAHQQAETLRGAAEQGQQEAIAQVANLKQQQADAQVKAFQAMLDANASIKELGSLLADTQDDVAQLNGAIEQLNTQIAGERQQAEAAAQEAEMWIQYYQERSAPTGQYAPASSTPPENYPRESVQSDCLKFNQGSHHAGHTLAGLLAGKMFSGKKWFSVT